MRVKKKCTPKLGDSFVNIFLWRNQNTFNCPGILPIPLLYKKIKQTFLQQVCTVCIVYVMNKTNTYVNTRAVHAHDNTSTVYTASVINSTVLKYM